MRNSKTFSVPSIADLPELAKELIRDFGDSKTWVFQGEMGAGKTTLIKEICHQLGVAQSVQSPTFSLVNEYVDGKGNPVYHFDLYRLKNAQEAFDIGLEEYLDSGHLCLVEWPEQAEEFWTFEHLELNVSHVDDAHRKLEVVWRRY